jgi:hypothetical protein
MEALEIEGQTDQTPLASGDLRTAQRELAKAQDLFDDPDHTLFSGSVRYNAVVTHQNAHIYTSIHQETMGQKRPM